MKQYSIYDMSNPDDARDFRTAMNADRYYFSLRNLDNYLRGKIKYEDLSEKETEIYQGVRDMLTSIMDDEGVSLEDGD